MLGNNDAWRAGPEDYVRLQSNKLCGEDYNDSIQALRSCHFIEQGDNVVFLGPLGVGKSNLAVGRGLQAIAHGYRALFATAAG